MRDLFETYVLATGGHKTVPREWMKATAVRPLLLEDPFLAWAEYHAEQFGLIPDSKQHSFTQFIMQKGNDFETKWVEEMLPDTLRVMQDGCTTQKIQSFLATLEHLHKDTPVMTSVALWWAPERIFGAADIIIRSDRLPLRFPHLKPKNEEPIHYVVMDCKFSTGLHLPKKARDYQIAALQVRIYSYILAHIQGYMAPRAYLITRDRPFEPVPVEVNMRLDEPLDAAIAELRERYIKIKLEGHNMLPWDCAETRPNWLNAKDEPWHNAKKQIRDTLMEAMPLETLPLVGSKQAAGLQEIGFKSLDQLLDANPDEVPFEVIHGIGDKAARRIRSTLQAHKTGKPSRILTSDLPPKRKREYFVDFEFLSNVNVDFETEWPTLRGKSMIFMIGIGWIQNKKWNFRRFAATAETHAAEEEMLYDFLEFLILHNIFDGDAVLYHWSPAEPLQTKQAITRSGIVVLDHLPWYDLKSVFDNGAIAVPGAWGLGIKAVAKAVGDLSEQHKVDWPDGLGEGLRAMVMAWHAYKQPAPLETDEMQLITDYLEIDCKALYAILSWLRANAVDVIR